MPDRFLIRHDPPDHKRAKRRGWSAPLATKRQGGNPGQTGMHFLHTLAKGGQGEENQESGTGLDLGFALSSARFNLDPNIKVYIYHSPLPRAKDTAVRIARKLGIRRCVMVVDYRLSEIEMGAWEGMSSKERSRYDSELHERFREARVSADHNEFLDTRYPDLKDKSGKKVMKRGESIRDVLSRSKRFVDDITREHPDSGKRQEGPIVIVGHGRNLNCIAKLMLNKDVEWMRNQRLLGYGAIHHIGGSWERPEDKGLSKLSEDNPEKSP